jgi:lipopolysaccharide/colanic/teichoic acid biosynthesis glycosyltransferase
MLSQSRQEIQRRSRRRVLRAARPQVLDQTLFRGAVVRERKRADRFDEAFVLLLLSLNCGGQPRRWSRVLDTLAMQKLETDLIGWHEQDATIGLLRPLASLDASEAASALAGTVRRELERSLKGDGMPGCSIRLEVYSPRFAAHSPVLDDDNPEEKRRSMLRRVAKRGLDIVGSVALLVACLPIFAVVAAAVKLTSRGPIFFRQQRVGESARPFMMLKFRTMQVDSDESLHKQYVTAFIQSGGDGTPRGEVYKIVNDPRVTPIGQFLRRASLDELPQFWNVLRGDMSLVGPRPPLPYEVARYKPWHRRRVLEAKPGITGLWQVTGRSRTTFDEMVRLDLRYARKHSLWTDIKILIATPRAVVTGKGAY